MNTHLFLVVLLGLAFLQFGQSLTLSGFRPINEEKEIAVAIILDASSSISPSDWDLMRKSAATIISKLPKKSHILVESFATTTKTEIPVSKLSAVEKANVMKKVSELKQSGGGTNLGLAITSVHIQLLQMEMERVVVLFTDGAPTDNFESYQNILKTSPDTVVIALGFGTANERKLELLASPNQSFKGNNLADVVTVLAHSLEPYYKVFARAIFPSETDFSFEAIESGTDTTLSFNINLSTHQGPAIPTGTKLFVDCSRINDNRPFFLPFQTTIQREIKPDGQPISIPITLTTAFVHINNIPQYLHFEIEDSRGRSGSFVIEFQAKLFAGDFLSLMSFANLTISVLGPVGSGKSTLIATCQTVLSRSNTFHAHLVQICSGVGHCTLAVDTHLIKAEYCKSPAFINFVDSIGIDNQNLEDGFTTYLLNGSIPNGYDSLTVPTVPAKNPPSDAVIVVVSQRLFGLEQSERDAVILQTKKAIEEAKRYNLPIIYVITHMDEVDLSMRGKILSDLQSLLGGASHKTFPMGFVLDEFGTLTFETQIQTLRILDAAVRAGKAQQQRRNARSGL